MSEIRKIGKLFLYAGVEKEEYEQLLPLMREENRELLKLFSQLAAVMFLVLYIASMLTNGFAATNSTTYLVCGVGMLLILFCTSFVVPKYPALVMVLFVRDPAVYFRHSHFAPPRREGSRVGNRLFTGDPAAVL